MEKVSFVSTVLNEEKSIGIFLDSLINQTRKPDEIVIVDAGSHDRTAKIIESYKNKFDKRLRLIHKKGNRSVGRNEAINKTKYNIIAVSDAGCVLDKAWLEEIIKPFEDSSIDVVAGFYKPITGNVFQKALATYTSTMPDKVDPDNFLPSSRSVAFKKTCWEKVKGYPENLETCEDLVFDKKLIKSGCRFIFNPDAVVFWPQRNTFMEAFWQFFSYAKGDGEARYFRSQTPILFGRYLFGLILLLIFVGTKDMRAILILGILFAFYLLWSIGKNYRYVGELKALYLLPVLQLTSDFAVLLGMSLGLLKKK